jgi:hypothetical protein
MMFILALIVGGILALVVMSLAGMLPWLYILARAKERAQTQELKDKLMAARLEKEFHNIRLAKERASKVFRDIEVLESRQALIDSDVAIKELKIEQMRKNAGYDNGDFTPKW